MPTPGVSVLMPVYNAEPTVAMSIRSILDGTFVDLELVIVDDGSTDQTIAQINAINDARIRIFSCSHRGITEALNEGLDWCRAPLIARMDADDIAQPTRLEIQLQAMADQQADIVGTSVRIIRDNGEPATTMQRYQAWINQGLSHDAMAAMRFVESPVVHPTVLAKREVFAMGYRQGPFPEDYDLWLRAFAQGYRFAKTPDILLDWQESAHRLTRTDARYSAQAFDRCRREHLLADPLRSTVSQGYPVDVWGAGSTGKPWVRWLQSVGIPIRQLIDVDPRKIGQRMHGVTVVSHEAMAPADGTLMIAAVGSDGAREEIKQYLEARDYQAGRDLWFVA